MCERVCVRFFEYQPNVIPSRILSASPTLMRYSATFPLGEGLILASVMYQRFMPLHSEYEPHP